MKPKLWLTTFLIAVTILLGSFLHPTVSQAEITKSFGAPIELGTPVTQISLNDATFGEYDGVDYMYGTENGSPAVFNVVNLDDNKLVKSFPMSNTRDSWTHVIDQHGNVFLTATGKLFKYSPETVELEDLGKHMSGAKESYAITLDEEGNVYGGTYPGAQFYKYDVSTGEYINYGSMVEGQDYVRSLAYHDGYVYAGIGPDGSLVRFNTETEEITEVEIPNRPNYYDVENLATVYDLNTVDNYLFVHLSENVLLIYDLVNERWLDETFDNYRSLNVAENAYNDKAYFVANGNIYSFDIKTEAFEDTGIDYGPRVRGAGWVTVEEDSDFPGQSMALQAWEGEITLVNFETNSKKVLPPAVEGQPTEIQALEKGPDGNLYISGFRSARGAKFDPETQDSEQFFLGQAEGMGMMDDNIYFGVYSGARIFEMDTTQSELEAKEIFDIDDGQDRPFTLTSGDDKLFVGTISTYGELGGALTVYDTVTEEVNTYRHVVENQSVTGLAYKDGKVYGSTSVWGGLGSEPSETEAKIFVWDVEKGEKVTEFAPDLDVDIAPKAIGELSFGPDGMLWGIAYGTIFAIDPETNEVIKSKTIRGTDWNYDHVWRPKYLRWGNDGYLYTNVGSQITVIDPDTLDYITLQDAPLMTLGNDGNIYYSDGAQLKMIPVYDGPGYSVTSQKMELTNPSFEQPLEGEKIPGWNIDTTFENSFSELSKERAYEGETSLKLTDTTTETAVVVSTDEIPVTPGVEYTGNMKVYLQDGRSIATFHFYNENGEKIQDNSMYITSGHGDWQDVSVKSIAPEGAVYAKLGAMVSNYWMATAYYDAFSVTYDAYETTPEVIDAENGSLYTTETNPSITVQGDERSTIYVYHGDDVIATVDSTGDEHAIQLNGLTEGEYQLTIKTIYENGKVSLDRDLLLVVDQTAPDAPNVLDPTRPWSTNNRTPEVTIEAEPGAIVKIVDKGEIVGTAEADDTGIAVVKTEPLTQGIHKMKAYAVDKAGNESELARVPHIIINNGKKPN